MYVAQSLSYICIFKLRFFYFVKYGKNHEKKFQNKTRKIFRQMSMGLDLNFKPD